MVHSIYPASWSGAFFSHTLATRWRKQDRLPVAYFAVAYSYFTNIMESKNRKMARHYFAIAPRSPDTKLSNGVEIVRGSSLPPGVEDEIKGELYFHVHSIEWEQTFKPPTTCSLILHWWGFPVEEFTIMAIPSLDYRPPDVTAIFPLRTGQKHLSRYFRDMGSLELVVVRDKKPWNGYKQAGSRLGMSSLPLEDLDEKHSIKATCFLYDEAQRRLGTLYFQVEVHYKTRYIKQLPKPVRGCKKLTKKNHNRTKVEGASFSNLNVDTSLNCERESWGFSDEAFAERLHDTRNKQLPTRKDICAHLESLEKDNQIGRGDWTSPHIQLTRGGESARGMRSASISDFRALGVEAALKTAYLQGIDKETAEMVSRIRRKQMNVHTGGCQSPGNKGGCWWSNPATEEILTTNCSDKIITESSMSEEESTLHRNKKANQIEQLPPSSAEDISLVLNRWFENAAAPSSKALTYALQDSSRLLDEKLDQLISDMKKGDSWTSTPGTPPSAQGEPSPQNGNDQVTSFQEMLPASQFVATGKLKQGNEHHLQKRRRNRSQEKGYKRNSGIQVKLGSPEQNATSIGPKIPGKVGQELTCASDSGSMVSASLTGPISEEIGGKWGSDCVSAHGTMYTSASTKDHKFFSRIHPSTEGDRQEQEPHLHSSRIVRQNSCLTLKSKPEASRQQQSEVDWLSRIIGRAAALRDALAQGSFTSRGSNLLYSKKMGVLACGNSEPKHMAQDSNPGCRPCVGSRDVQKEPGNTGTHHGGLLATVLQKLQEERPSYEGERTDSTFVDRILRFTNSNILPDGQDDPREVAEEALLKELFFPGQQESPDQKTYNVIQEIGCNNSEALAVERAGHTMHSSQGPLCLAISVENLILLDAYARDLTSCKCLLTLCFPAVKLLVADTKTSPEQVVSISPVARRQRELVFEHQSQSHWQLPSEESGVDTWRSQLVKVNVSFKWPSSDVVRCEGTIPLERVAQSIPLAYFTDLQLIRVKEFTKTPWNGNANFPRTSQKSEARATSNRVKVLGGRNGHFHKKPSKATSSPPPISSSESKVKLYATVRIGLRLFADSDQQTTSGVKGLPQQPRELLDKKATQSAKQVAQRDFSWFYVSVDYFYNFQSINDDETLDLVIKMSTDTVSRTPFSPPVYKQDPRKGGCTARQNADAVICSSTSIKTPIIFVEIWRTSVEPKKDGLEHLIGIIRVPLLSSNNSETVAAAEVYPVYNPVKDYTCGDANVVVMRGLKSEMLKLQKENHASPKGLCSNLEEARAEGSGTSTTAAQPVNSSHHCAMTRHVFEVKVQELSGLPAARILGFSRCSQTGGGFIKYLFPGEKEALFTQEVKWNQHMSFQASVRHVISLHAGEDLREHLEREGNNNLRFELWGYCSKLWGYEPDVVQALGKLNIDRRSKTLTRKGSIPNPDPGEEQHMGTALLPLQKMFDLLKEWRRAGSTGEVKKTFRIPFTLVGELQDMDSEVSTVTVQLAYERGQATQQENPLADTIFVDKGLMSVVGVHPLEVSLEINIIRATSLQSAINAVLLLNTSLLEAFVDGVNSYVQFSPFPCNAKLEETYPPTSTPLKEKELVPNYGWTTYMSLLLDSWALKELRTKDMTFEVWHSSTHSTHKDIWLGTASAPCLPLLENIEGVNGWVDLLSRKGEIVGALQVAVCFTGWH